MKSVFIALLLALCHLNSQAEPKVDKEPFSIKGFKLNVPVPQNEKCKTKEICAAATTLLGEEFDVMNVYLNNRREFVLFIPTRQSINKIETDGYFSALIESISEKSHLQPTATTLFDSSLTRLAVDSISKESLINAIARKNCPANAGNSMFDYCRKEYISKISLLESKFRLACGDCNAKITKHSWSGEGFDIQVIRSEYPNITAEMNDLVKETTGDFTPIKIFHFRSDCGPCKELMGQFQPDPISGPNLINKLKIDEQDRKIETLKREDLQNSQGKKSDL